MRDVGAYQNKIVALKIFYAVPHVPDAAAFKNICEFILRMIMPGIVEVFSRFLLDDVDQTGLYR